jgi:hypothetical protein
MESEKFISVPCAIYSRAMEARGKSSAEAQLSAELLLVNNPNLDLMYLSIQYSTSSITLFCLFV